MPQLWSADLQLLFDQDLQKNTQLKILNQTENGVVATKKHFESRSAYAY